jgi:6-phosphogluconolactonase
LSVFARLSTGIAVAAMTSLLGSVSALAATYVYVSNADDGDISTYRMLDSGELQPGARVKAAAMVMPMAVSPDRHFLYAAAQAKPYTALVYSINAGTGALTQIGTAPLADSLPYISLDKTGRTLFGASYFGSLVTVNAVGSDGRVAAVPSQVIPVGRHANSIHVDNSNRFAYAATLGSDAIFMFHFDAKSGRLSSSTPAVVMMKPYTGPRHFVTSPDNKFLFVLNELVATVTTLAIDGKTGLLTEVDVAGALQPDTGLSPGLPRVPMTSSMVIRHVEKDIWAGDIHVTPNGKFVYVSERNSDVINALSVDGATGKLTMFASTPTERQPRGFAIDPTGRYLVVAGELSPTVSVFAIDQASGALKPLGKYPTGKGANWVEIVNFD